MAIKPDKAFLVAFGKHVTDLRIKRGYSVIELTDRAGISRAQLYKIEAGNTNASMIAVKQLAEALEVPLTKMMDFEY